MTNRNLSAEPPSRLSQKAGNRAEPVENRIAREVVDAALRVHTGLGPGLLESAYEAALAYELRSRGVSVMCQLPVNVHYRGVILGEGFRVDLAVDDIVLVELKSVEHLQRVHKKQLLTYLRLSGRRLGLLLNFGAPLMKDGIARVVNGLPN